MTKEQLIDIIQKYVPDGEQIALGGWWYKADVEDWHGEPLTEDQWERFVYWFDKYQDASSDADEALFYALKEEK
jgi:hypothetical protein